MEKKSLFKSQKISNSVTRIAGITGELMYLVEGKEKAVLLDTGAGAGNIKEYVENLTSLPVLVILTHGHMDHAGGASLFQEVYLHRKDWGLAKVHCTLDMQREYVQMTAGENAALVKNEDYVKYIENNFMPLHYGDLFDLGGITLEIVEGTGHTQGSVCVFIKEELAILLGDACNPFTFMFSEECSSIEEYLEVLLKLKERSNEFDRVYLSHGPGDGPKSIIDDVIETCREIMQGKVDDVEFNFMGQTAYIAHRLVGPGQREDGKVGNVVYNKEKIFKCTI